MTWLNEIDLYATIIKFTVSLICVLYRTYNEISSVNIPSFIIVVSLRKQLI